MSSKERFERDFARILDNRAMKNEAGKHATRMEPIVRAFGDPFTVMPTAPKGRCATCKVGYDAFVMCQKADCVWETE